LIEFESSVDVLVVANQSLFLSPRRWPRCRSRARPW
jgi:hypothetical protein